MPSPTRRRAGERIPLHEPPFRLFRFSLPDQRASHHRIGARDERLPGKLSVPADFSKRLTEQGLALLSITAEHAEAIRDFPELARHDPFDRLLVAQAARTGLRLLTADQILLALGSGYIIDAGR